MEEFFLLVFFYLQIGEIKAIKRVTHGFCKISLYYKKNYELKKIISVSISCFYTISKKIKKILKLITVILLFI